MTDNLRPNQYEIRDEVGYCRTVHHGAFSTNAAHTKTPQCVAWRPKPYTGLSDGPDLVERKDVEQEYLSQSDRLARNWQLRWKEANDRADSAGRAIEHGGYLATAAERFQNAYNQRAMAEESGEEVDVDAFSDCFRALSSAIYEFRKRAEVPAAPPTEPK